MLEFGNFATTFFISGAFLSQCVFALNRVLIYESSFIFDPAVYTEAHSNASHSVRAVFFSILLSFTVSQSIKWHSLRQTPPSGTLLDLLTKGRFA